MQERFVLVEDVDFAAEGVVATLELGRRFFESGKMKFRVRFVLTHAFLVSLQLTNLIVLLDQLAGLLSDCTVLLIDLRFLAFQIEVTSLERLNTSFRVLFDISKLIPQRVNFKLLPFAFSLCGHQLLMQLSVFSLVLAKILLVYLQTLIDFNLDILFQTLLVTAHSFERDILLFTDD